MRVRRLATCAVAPSPGWLPDARGRQSAMRRFADVAMPMAELTFCANRRPSSDLCPALILDSMVASLQVGGEFALNLKAANCIVDFGLKRFDEINFA